MNSIDEAINVLQAVKQGKPIQFRSKPAPGNESCDRPYPAWRDCIPISPTLGQLNFNCFEFRVKPEPREWYITLSREGYPEGVGIHRFSFNLQDGRHQVKVREVEEP